MVALQTVATFLAEEKNFYGKLGRAAAGKGIAHIQVGLENGGSLEVRVGTQQEGGEISLGKGMDSIVV